MKYVAPLDPHTHLRGTEYAGHDFTQKALDDAYAVGLCGLMEMPNCQPFVTSHMEWLYRGAEIRKLRHNDLWLKCHPGLSLDMEKNMELLAKVATHKIFFCHSTGNMGIIDPEFQERLWQAMHSIGFRGVSIGHFEAENCFTRPFDPSNPISHSIRQHEGAELAQVIHQLRNAVDHQFEGTFYVAHASNPATIDFLNHERAKVRFDIAIEVTWHHMFLNWKDYDYACNGNRVKMNPPLRAPQVQEAILERVLTGKIDVIGTDHAPHPLERKVDSVNPASGIPAIPFYPAGIHMLRALGMHEGLIQNATFFNANRIFHLHMQPTDVEREYDRTLWEKYGYNPFARVDH